MVRMEKFVWAVLAISILFFGSNPAEARTKFTGDMTAGATPPRPQVAAATSELRVHKVGKFWLAVTNYGKFGSESLGLTDPCTRNPAPSGEFPAGTGVNYLFQGALWISAIVDTGALLLPDTLVTVGADGWQQDEDMTPDLPWETRTIRPNGLQQGTCIFPYSVDAVSEQDFIATVSDTTTDPNSIPPGNGFDGPFRPIGLQIIQKSYAWSFDYSQDFVLFDYVLKNAKTTDINGLYMALYIDADNHNNSVDGQGFQDDISGFLEYVPSFASPLFNDTLNVAWTGDNDGLSSSSANPDVIGGVFIPNYSPTSLAGTRVVRAPGNLTFSFNWWNSQSDANLDWGPWTLASSIKRPDYFYGVLGTPEGDKNKYFIMSNGEFDYDQLFACLDQTADGWLPPHPGGTAIRKDMADGYDTRYLLSFGPFNIPAGDSVPLTLAYIAGEDFHVRADDFQGVDVCNVTSVNDYYSKLDFNDFAANARWAGWVYDNPGVDSDTLDANPYKGKYRIVDGDTVYYEGDGIPDFTGPPPPTPPVLAFATSEGVVDIQWNGRVTETGIDIFSNLADFEGYRVYLSRSGFANDYALLDSYDLVDYKMYVFNPDTQKWKLRVASLSPDSIVSLFQTDDPCCFLAGNQCTCIPNCGLTGAFGNDPGKWTFANPYNVTGACGDIQVTSSVKVQAGDKLAFETQDWNQPLSAVKVYQPQIDSGLLGPGDSLYYEYSYSIDGLVPSQPVHIAVSAFDFGNPQTGLSPLETSVLVNSQEIWPVPQAGSTAEKVAVWPNPYKITETYLGEDRNLPSGKRIYFMRLPEPVCTVRVFTLDGDEVAVIENNGPSDQESSDDVISWNLLSTNSQEVVAGLYVYVVESDAGNQIGKFVIIK